MTTDELTAPRVRSRMAVVFCLAVIAATCLHCAMPAEQAEVPGFYSANHKCGVDLLFLNENGVYVRYTRMPDGQEHCDTALWEYVYDWDSLGWGKYQYLYLNDWVVYWVYEWECDRAEIPTQPWQLNQERISCYCASIEKWMGMVRLIITEEEGTYYIKVDPDKIPDSLLLA